MSNVNLTNDLLSVQSRKLIDVFYDEINREHFDSHDYDGWLMNQFRDYCDKRFINYNTTMYNIVQFNRMIDYRQFTNDYTDALNDTFGQLVNRHAMDYMSFNYFVDLVNDDNDILLKSSYRYIHHAIDETRFVNDYDLVGNDIYSLGDFDFYPSTERLICERILLGELKNFIKTYNVNIHKVDDLDD